MQHARKDYNRIQDPENLIPQEEPVFLIRAQDPIAAEVARYWAFKYAQDPRHDPSVVDLVVRHAKKMDEWQPKKSIADVPAQ